MSVFAETNNLVEYAVKSGLIGDADITCSVNRISEILCIKDFKNERPTGHGLEKTLLALCNYAADAGIIGRTQTEFDLFDTRLMGALTPLPSTVIREFRERYKKSPSLATDWYYNFSQATDYIRRYRIARDMKWTAETEFGELDITINLSKPEKDPREIARAKEAHESGYPECILCRESEGYSGRPDFPARQNHRVIPIELGGQQWYFQYSPYVYYNEHCIALSGTHVPMKIDRDVFCRLFDFIDIFPHYFIGSNADLPIVGGSILSHEHFQGGRYSFPMERAPIEKVYTVDGFEDVCVGRVRWPMSVLRIRDKSRKRVESLAGRILDAWRGYTDESVFIFAETGGEAHNTITPIARRRGELYELDLVLRNNITTKEHPLGVFHPHEELHHIKRENIGLIEVMGLAVLPARIKREFALLCGYIDAGRDIRSSVDTEKHARIAERIEENREAGKSTEELLKRETGLLFAEVLKCAGVFKRDDRGFSAFDGFVKSI